MSVEIFIGWSSILQDRPEFLSDNVNDPRPGDPPTRIRHYEALMRSHGRHPYLLARLGVLTDILGSRGAGIAFLQEALEEMAAIDLEDPKLEALIETWNSMEEDEGRQAIQMSYSGTLQFGQTWKASKYHFFPALLRALPVRSPKIKETWQSLFPLGSILFRRYLRDLVIETNQIERTFLLTTGSTQDLIRRGLAEGAVEIQPASRLDDRSLIKSILNDTLAAYDLLSSITDDLTTLTPEMICSVHARLMENARFNGAYIPPGQTRTITRKTVYIDSGNGIQCCPYFAVEGELHVICQKARELFTQSQNPFAIASWLHLVLARCHPFDDGNGRTTRLISSIPLIIKGYPPIVIPLAGRSEYFQAINKAYLGDHLPMIKCFLDGMEATLAHVEKLD